MDGVRKTNRNINAKEKIEGKERKERTEKTHGQSFISNFASH